jgi:hypothetical protein
VVFLRRLVANKRAWRLTLIGVIIIPILIVLPHARSLVVRNAVTTAYLPNLNAPISGYVEDISVAAGSVSLEGMPLFTRRNCQVVECRGARLEVLVERAQREVGRRNAQLEWVRTLAR